MNPTKDPNIIVSDVKANLETYTIDLADTAEDPKAVLAFSIYDNKTKEFGPPTTAISAALIVTSVMGHIKESPSSPYAIRPMDFSLHCVGLWLPTHGMFSQSGTRICKGVGNLADLIEHLTPDDLHSILASVDRMLEKIIKS